MSKFKKKAQEVLAEGTDARGDFTPHGVPKRMYSYWLGMTWSPHGIAVRGGRRKENFCHFWRVVAIWAPLMFLKNKFLDGLDATLDGLDRITNNNGVLATVVTVASAGLIIALTSNPIAVLKVIAGSLAVLLFAVVVVVAIVVFDAGAKQAMEMDVDGVDKAVVKWTVFPLGVFWVVGWLVGQVISLIASLYYKAEMRGKTGWFWTGLIGLIGLVTSEIVALLSGTSAALITLGLFGLVPLLLFGLVTLLAAVGENIEGKRRARDDEAWKKRWEEQRAFSDWLYENYEGAFIAQYGRPPHFFDELNDFYLETRPQPKPSKIAAFLSDIGDFLILVAQIVRVNKWKICPIVTIEDVDSKASV